MVKKVQGHKLGLQVNAASESRIQRHLELLQLLPQLVDRLLQLRHVLIDLLRGRGEHGLRVRQRKLEEGVTDLVAVDSMSPCSISTHLQVVVEQEVLTGQARLHRRVQVPWRLLPGPPYPSVEIVSSEHVE